MDARSVTNALAPLDKPEAVNSELSPSYLLFVGNKFSLGSVFSHLGYKTCIICGNLQSIIDAKIEESITNDF